MAQNYYRGKKRYKIKYKNLAIVLAILLLIVLLICRACSGISNRKDDLKRNEPLNSGDNMPDPPPEDDVGIPLDSDPSKQEHYVFAPVQMTNADIGTGTTILVNNKIAYKGNITEDDLVIVREKKNNAYSVKDYTVMILPEPMDKLNEMLLDFYTATGNDNLIVNSGYRSIERQEELYQEELDSTGQESSDLVAKPGYSEHHTGLVVDFTTFNPETNANKQYDGTGDYAWINDNCYKYGFVNRYPAEKKAITMIDNEPWHFRYVGLPHSKVMHDYDLCLEEYIDFMRNYTIDTGFLGVTLDDGSEYYLYYVPSMGVEEITSVFVPLIGGSKDTYPYTISGNNVDGWIVSFLYKEGAPDVNTVDPVVTTAPETEPEVTTEPDAE